MTVSCDVSENEFQFGSRCFKTFRHCLYLAHFQTINGDFEQFWTILVISKHLLPIWEFSRNFFKPKIILKRDFKKPINGHMLIRMQSLKNMTAINGQIYKIFSNVHNYSEIFLFLILNISRYFCGQTWPVLSFLKSIWIFSNFSILKRIVLWSKMTENSCFQGLKFYFWPKITIFITTL